MSSASEAIDFQEKLNISSNCSYPLFFETKTKTFVLLIESDKDNVVQSVKLGINSKENPNPFFTVVGYDGDNKTLFNIIDEDIDNALYSVVGYDETGKNLQITIVPSDTGAVVVVNTTRTTLMKSPPLVGKSTKEKIHIQHASILGVDVMISGIPSTSPDFNLNGKRGKICGLPVEIESQSKKVEFEVPVAFLKGEINEAAERRLVKTSWLVDISLC